MGNVKSSNENMNEIPPDQPIPIDQNQEVNIQEFNNELSEMQVPLSNREEPRYNSTIHGWHDSETKQIINYQQVIKLQEVLAESEGARNSNISHFRMDQSNDLCKPSSFVDLPIKWPS